MTTIHSRQIQFTSMHLRKTNLSQINSVHVSPSRFLKIHFNIILYYRGTKSDSNICGTGIVLSNNVERIVITILSGLQTLRAHS
jgi:hypothetical protein